MAQLNGWQRLWVVVSVCLGLMVFLEGPPSNLLRAFFDWAVLVGVLYAFGWAIAWVRRGFARDRRRCLGVESSERADRPRGKELPPKRWWWFGRSEAEQREVRNQAIGMLGAGGLWLVIVIAWGEGWPELLQQVLFFVFGFAGNLLGRAWSSRSSGRPRGQVFGAVWTSSSSDWWQVVTRFWSGLGACIFMIAFAVSAIAAFWVVAERVSPGSIDTGPITELRAWLEAFRFVQQIETTALRANDWMSHLPSWTRFLMAISPVVVVFGGALRESLATEQGRARLPRDLVVAVGATAVGAVATILLLVVLGAFGWMFIGGLR